MGRTALVCGLLGAVSVGMLSLATETATYAVFTVLLVVFAAAAVVLGDAAVPAARALPPLPAAQAARAAGVLRTAQAVPACGAVVCGMVLARAVGASWGSPGIGRRRSCWSSLW